MKIKPVDHEQYVKDLEQVDSHTKLAVVINKHGVLSFNKWEVLDIVERVENKWKEILNVS